jgi:NDP-sugar pyrophosphorylase family protein
MPTAVIIAGGEGTRLRPLTLSMPKGLVPILGRPFLDYQLASIRAVGMRRVVFNLHYMPDAIRRRYGDGSDWGMGFRYSVEEHPMGTAGAVKMGEEYFGDDELVVFNGDVLTDIDVSDVIEFHRSRKARVTITLVRVDDSTAYGLVFTDDDGRVERFLEKPSREQATVDTINAGLYVLNRDVMDDIPPKTHYTFERGLYPELLKRGDAVYGYIHEGYWLDIGTPGKYLKACSDLASRRAGNPFPLESISPGGIYGHPGVKIDPLADLTGPCYIDKGSSVGSGKVGPNVFLGRNVAIGDNVKLSNSIILDRTTIEDGAVIAHALISPDCRVGSHVLLASGTLLGAFSRVTGP